MEYQEIEVRKIEKIVGRTIINRNSLVLVNNEFISRNLIPRTGGPLIGHAIYLDNSEDYDWVLGRDSYGLTCLVPLKREINMED